MWNRILGKSSELERKSSTSENLRKHDSQRSTARRADSQKSTESSRKTTRSEEHDRGFNPTSTSYSSTTQNRYPGTASASIASSHATAFNHPTNEAHWPPGLVRNASLADQIPKTLPDDGQPALSLVSGSKAGTDKDDLATMEERRRRKQRRGTREKDDDGRESKSHREKKRRNSAKGNERAITTDEVPYSTSQRTDELPTNSSGVSGSSAFVGQHDPRPEYADGQALAQSSHVQDQFPGQFPAQTATPYRPPLAAREGGPGLAAEYYGDAGQSVIDQPGVRMHSPSLIVGAEPHLQAASVIAAPPPEPSASGAIGAAASFFDGTFSAGSDTEARPSQKPATIDGSSSIQFSSAAPSTSTHTTSGARPSTQHAISAPVIPSLGSAPAGAVAGYYLGNDPSKPARPDQGTSSTSGYGKTSESASHHPPPETIQGLYTSYPSASRPPTMPGKHSSESSNVPLYAAGAAGVAAAAAYHHNHHGSTSSHHGPTHHPTSYHGSTHHGHPHHASNGHYYAESSMAQQFHHHRDGPFSKLVDFFKDPDGVAQFEEYTEYIGVCRHCFDPRSSPRDAPRKHHYRRRRSDGRFGSNVRIDKDHRYSSSESESRRRKKTKSWIGAGIAGYGLGNIGGNLFLHDNDSHDSHSGRHGKGRTSRRRESSSSSERKSRTSYGVVKRSSDTTSRRSRSKDRVETGITGDGKLYRRDSHGNIETLKVKTDTSRRRSRSRSRSRDRRSNASNIALGAALGSGLVASHSRRRSKSPKKAFVRSKHRAKESSSELASVLELNESDPPHSRHASRHSPESRPQKSHRKEKKRRGFFNFSNNSSSSSTSSDLGVEAGYGHRTGRKAKTRGKGKESRDAEAALLGLGAAALAFNQSQRPKRKSELIAVKESKGKHKVDNHGREGKRPSSGSEDDPWESASEGEHSSADSELAYGGSLHRKSQESLSSESSGLDKWGWRWRSKKQARKTSEERRHSPTFDKINPVAATAAMMTGASHSPPRPQNQDSRMTSNSSIPLQHVYPMPTSDPTQFDVARHDAGGSSYQPFMNARPDPVPLQHPQPVAPVSTAVYTSQAPYSHAYSAPIGLSSVPQYGHPPSSVLNQDPGAFPTGNEYFEPFVKDSKRDPQPRRRDSSPVMHAPELTSSSAGPRRRKSLKDDGSSVRFDLTKEQEDKDRRDERRRRKEEGKRRERLERRELDEGEGSERDSPQSAAMLSRESEHGITREPWAAPAAAGVIAAAIGATASVGPPSNDKFEEKRRRDHEERDIEVIVRERPASNQETASSAGRGPISQKTGMSVWQAAAKVKRSPNYTGYAAYFTPTELLSKESGVKETVDANADNDITVHQVPNMIIEPSEPGVQSPSRSYSFPITAEDMEHSVKPLPWAVPELNLVPATPPMSRAGSAIGEHSPRVRSPLSSEVHDIPLELLESVTTPDSTTAQPAHVEYTIIEPKGHSTDLVDSPVSDKDVPESVPGISSLEKKQKPRYKSPSAFDYGEDLDFTATVAAGLQDTGFSPSIVVDDPSFRRRDSPPGSEDNQFRRRATTTVTEVTSELPMPQSPPHGFVEEIEKPHIPGSFHEAEEQVNHSQHEEVAFNSTRKLPERSRSPEELTGPSDNDGRKPHVYSTETDAFKPEDITNAAVDPMQDRPYKYREQAKQDTATEAATEPADNVGVKPHIYTAEPESFGPEDTQNVTIDPILADQRSMTSRDDSLRSQPRAETSSSGYANVADPMSDDIPSITASPHSPSNSWKDSKSNKKSKRRSVGFDDNTSVISSPQSYTSKQESSTPSKSGRKAGIFGLFSKSTDNLPESKGIQQTPVEASLEDFEEPRERKKKSKSRRSDRDGEEIPTATTESAVFDQAGPQDDWDTPKKSKRSKEKRRSSGDPGRITQGLPTQVIPKTSSGHGPFRTPDEMLTNLEDQEPSHSRNRSGGSDVAFNEIAESSRMHENQQPSFLGERPEKPPLPDIPDASEDPGGHIGSQNVMLSEQDLRPPADQCESPMIKTDRPNRSISDLQPDGRSVSYSSPSPTAIPLRPLRFGRRPSSPGLAMSLPSTPQPSTMAEIPFTPRRRERPHSTEFKSNEYRPMWLLEKYGSRQEPTRQETYPSLPSSHSTSRASSVHESDDLYRTEALDLASDKANYPHPMQEPHGLSIDTSYHEKNPELLDSQQATPTAASFQSRTTDNNMHALESAKEAPSNGRAPSPELTDLLSPAASGYHDPLADQPDQRLLHGVEDLFPQPRATLPFRYDASVEAGVREQAIPGDTALEPSEKESHNGPASVLRNAALEDLIGGSAAAFLKSTSQHDEYLEQASDYPSFVQTSKGQEGLAPNQNSGMPGRPSAEEARLLQEQDAQDAVDSWFAQAQSKRPKVDEKGRKRGKGYEIQATSSTSSNEPPTQLNDNQVLRVGHEQAGSALTNTTTSIEPGEPKARRTVRDESSNASADRNYEAALTNRRDSKGKKKKNKKKISDPWGESPTDSTGVIQEQQLNPEPGVRQSPSFTDPSMIEPSSVEAVAMNEPPSLFTATETLPDNEAQNITVEAEASPAPIKKIKKVKKKTRSLSLADPVQEETLEPSTESEPLETAFDKVLSTGSLDIPIETSLREDEPGRSVSAEIPYALPPTEGPQLEGPADSLEPVGQPVTVETLTGVDASTISEDVPFDKPFEDQLSEANHFSAAKSFAAERDSTLNQQFALLDTEGRVSPKTIPLPPDDDLDLRDTLPESPILKPIDASIPGKEQPFADQDSPGQEAIVSGILHDRSSVKVSEIEPTILNKAISELALPQTAAAAPDAEKDQSDTFASFPSKKTRKDKKNKKGERSPPPAFEIGGSAEEPGNGQSTIPDPLRKHVTDDLGTLPEEAVETLQEQSTDAWTDFTHKKGKKGDKGLKGKSIREESKSMYSGSSPLKIDQAPMETVKDTPVKHEPSATSAIPAAKVSSEESWEVDSKVSTPNKPEPLEFMEEPTHPAIAEGDEWPSVSKKKKNGKDNRGAQSDDFSGAQSEGSEAGSTSKRPAAGTGTAMEVQDLLHRPGPENESRELDETHMPEASLPVSPTQVSASEPVKLAERTSAGSLVHGASPEAIASTGTAAEVREMLSKADESEIPQALGQDSDVHREQAKEADGSLWASIKKAKKGEKSKMINDSDVKKLQEQPVESGTPVAGDLSQDEPVEEPSAKKSKKDRKSKRQDLSRSASVLEPSNTQQHVPSAVQKPLDAGMAMTDNAPSLLERIDQLPHLGTQIPSEIEQSISPPIRPSAPEVTTATEELSVSAMARDIDFDQSSHVLKPLAVFGESPEMPRVEEMEMSANAPSILEKRDELPTIELPLSEELGALDDGRGFATASATADQAQENNGIPLHDLPSPVIDSGDTNLALEGLPKSTGSPAISIRDGEVMVKSPVKDPGNGAASRTSASNETIEVVNSEPTVETRAKSKKDKKSKKSKVAAWEDNSPVTLGELSKEPDEAQEVPNSLKIEEPAEDVAAEDEIEGTKLFSVPRKEKRKAKKAKKSAWDDNVPEAITGAVESRRDSIEAEREQPSKLVVEETPAIAPQPFQSKKDKRKSKKSKAFSMEEEAPSVEAAVESSQLPILLQKPELTEKSSSEPAEPSAEIDFVMPTSKKGKKKSKKSKFVAWDEDETTIPTEDEPRQQAIAPPEAKVVDEDPEVIDETSAKDSFEIIDQKPPVKKGKKKGKKFEFVEFDEEPSLTPSRDEEIPLDPIPLETESNVGIHREFQQPQVVEDVTSIREEAPKERKEGKKSKSVGFTEEFAVPSVGDETSGLHPTFTRPEVVAGDSKDVQEQTTLEDEFVDSFEQQTSIISRKSELAGWEQASSRPPFKDGSEQQGPPPTNRKLTIEPTGHIETPTEMEESILPHNESPIAKNDKKRHKESKFVALGEEPSVPLVDDGMGGKAREVGQTSFNLLTEGNGGFQTTQKPVMAAAKPTEDEKNVKKARDFSRDEQPSPAIEEPLDSDPGVHHGLGDPTSKTSEMTGDVYEPRPADQAKDAERGATETGALQINSPISLETESADDAIILRDAPLESVERTTAGEHSVPDLARETIPEPYHGESERPPSAPPVDVSTAEADPVVARADEQVELKPHSHVRHEDHMREHAVNTPSDPPSRDASPLLLEVADVHIDPVPAHSTEDALKVAEESTPDKSIADCLAVSQDSVKKPLDPSTVPTALGNPELGIEQERIDSGPDTSGDAPIEPVEQLQAFEARVDDFTEQFALVNKQDKKKAKKLKKTTALGDESIANVHGANVTMDEKTKGIDTASDQPIPLPNTISEEALEDHLAVSRKDKEKSKKKNQAFSFANDSSESTVPVESEPRIDIVDQNASAEPLLPNQSKVAEDTADLPFLSKKEKKKGKKSKKTYGAYDEPSRSATSTEHDAERDLVDQEAEGPSLPVELSVSEDFGSTSLSRKDTKNSIKIRTPIDSDEEPSLDTAPREPSLNGTLTSQIEERTLPVEQSLATADADLPDQGNKGIKQSRTKSENISFDQEPAEDITAVEQILDKGLAEQIEEPSMSARPSVTIAEEDFPEPGKKVKRSKKNKKTFDLDDESMESLAAAGSEGLEGDPVVDRLPGLPDVSMAEAPEPFSTASSKKGKKSKKNKKAHTFDDEFPDSATPAEPENLKDISIGQPSLPTEATMAEASEDFFPTSSKKEKSKKKNKKAVAFEDEPLQDTPIESVGQRTEELSIPTESSVTEPIDDYDSLSKKDRKKAKKIKKASAFDEPIESLTPQKSNEPRESIEVEVPVDFIPDSKKDKKKTKKGKKESAREDDALEASPMVEKVATLGEIPQPVSALPSVPQLEQGGEEAMSPQVASPVIPAQFDSTGFISEGQPKGEESIMASTAEIDDSVNIASPIPEFVPEINQPDLFVASKKSKKDKKKAKNRQAFSWGDDEDTPQHPLPEMTRSADDMPTHLPDIQEDRGLGPVSEQADLAAPPSFPEDTEQSPTLEPPSALPFVEQERAPRHQIPTLTTPADAAIPFEPPLSSPHQKPLEQPRNPGIESTVEDPISQPVAPAAESIGAEAQTDPQQMSLRDDEGFTPSAPTKKSKKGKKGKKQVIDWEEDTVPVPEPAQDSSKAVSDIDVTSRPEMTAWPTEVRLNQTPATFNPEEQPASPAGIVNDPLVAQDQFLADEPQEPPPIEDDRSDYFGHEPSRDFISQPQPFENDAPYAQPNPSPLPLVEDIRSKVESSIVHDDGSVEPSHKRADLPSVVPEQPHAEDTIAGPVDDIAGSATARKEKKSKRKKKQALDDVMWEFPSIPTTAELTPVESKWPSDPSRGERLYREPATDSMSGEQNLADPERIAQEKYAATDPTGQTSGTPIDTRYQVDTQGESVITEEPQVEEAVDEDQGAVSKKAKKGKKSKKSKASEYLAESEMDAQQAAQKFEEVEDVSRTGEVSSSPSVGTVEAIAAAAAVSAGLATAEGFARKESKKDKKKRKAQASSSWTEPEEDFTPRSEAAIEDYESTSQERVPTPERRSPIQAWHQNISPTESPRHSELYEVEDERPRAAASFRRKRSNDDERRQSRSAERRSPIEAWHQYDTPGHSPQQSELYDYDGREARGTAGQESAGVVNRDSAVHVSDSPAVSQQSPVRRAMRDSGYPDTETSPVVAQGAEKQESVQGVPQGLSHIDGESVGANPLQILSEDVPEGRQQQKRTRSRSPSRHEDDDEDLDLPPRYPIRRSSDDVREPSPVSSTTKDRSSVLFQSSPSTREEQANREGLGATQTQGSPPIHGYHLDHGEEPPHPTGRSLTPAREDNSAMVNARAESLAALSGLRGSDPDRQRTSLFGGPVEMSTSPEPPMDQDSVNRRRLNTITEYSPEESPLHKKNREVSDVGVSAHGVKAARRSGTPLAITKQRARSPFAESGAEGLATTDAAPRPFWPSIDEGSRNTEQRPSSHQSNISSLVSGPPKQREYERRSFSGASNHSVESINAFIRTPPEQMRSASGMSNRSSGTPPLRRVDRSVSSDLRGANRKSEANRRAKQPEAPPAEVDPSISVPVPVPSTSPTNDSTTDRSKGRVKGMADVFEGYGDFHGSPRSPTRPPSVRRRQSMQVLELESRNDRLTAENRQLHEAKLRAERDFEDAAHHRDQEIASYREGIESRETWLRQKDSQLSQLKQTIENLQAQVAQLHEVNQELHASSRGLTDHQEQYTRLEGEHAETHQKWQQSTRELEDLRQQHAQLSAGMEDIVRHEVTTSLESKNLELHRLQSDLSSAQSQIRTLQAQILASKHNTPSSDSLLSRDEDYFDSLCQSLCSHVQQWVLRFSKFSDSRACYLASEIRDEKIVDRMENAILDGSDVDTYLADRVKRRDVFMSMVMTMTWEFIFTRYLFGADREQRQKLKALEKTLSESPSNSRQAIHKWRATTLHLLSKREAFVKQRETDTEAVMHQIYSTLATILPPPSPLVPQIQSSLSKVLTLAVDLSIEMRTQRFEYVMLPPLQPEYDTNGDLARKVYFNAALMNERGSEAGGVGNEELERRGAVVRMVLFPLVVRKGEMGEGGEGQVEEIVVWPALVLCADAADGREKEGKGKKNVRTGSQRGSVEMGGMF
ncbi:MAG: hypothetical protein LQ339_004220 [Xanthoria mediterranea]|nr:MAG: hypothetical protein LQ339_004220 [Xanthoria mediterranea]